MPLSRVDIYFLICKTDDFINKICKDTKTEEKVSVKGELNNIKKTFSEKVRSPIQKEQVR